MKDKGNSSAQKAADWILDSYGNDFEDGMEAHDKSEEVCILIDFLFGKL